MLALTAEVQAVWHPKYLTTSHQLHTCFVVKRKIGLGIAARDGGCGAVCSDSCNIFSGQHKVD